MKQTILRSTTGLIITLIGVGALLGALDIIPFWDIFREWWPTLLVIAGIFTLVGDFRQNYIWGALLVTVGSLLVLKNHDLITFNVFNLIFPILIISAGLSVLLSAKHRVTAAKNSADSDDISAIFSGSETINASKKYQGGRLTAVFGGIDLDLRDAKLANKASIDLFVLCGGVELKVPRDWKVISKVTPVAGGIENKSRGDDTHDGPVLILTGTVALGGVEVKS